MTPNASKQSKFGSWGAIFLFIFLPCMWGLGLQKESPLFRPKLTKIDHFGPFWSRECQNPVRNKVILTKMVVWTVLDHFGPVHFPTVPQPLPIYCAFFSRVRNQAVLSVSSQRLKGKSGAVAGAEAFFLGWNEA